jgi:hypothetical protein
MGFGHGQSERAVRLYGTVHASLDALLAGKGIVMSVQVFIQLRAFSARNGNVKNITRNFMNFILHSIEKETHPFICIVKNLVANEEEMYVSDGETEEEDNDPRYVATVHLVVLYHQ